MQMTGKTFQKLANKSLKKATYKDSAEHDMKMIIALLSDVQDVTNVSYKPVIRC